MWRCSRWNCLALLVITVSMLFSSCSMPWSGTGSDADTITFGATISVTGTLAEEGQYTRDGYLMAINTINREGGIKIGGKAYHLALRYYDDESRPDLAAQLYTRLITA